MYSKSLPSLFISASWGLNLNPNPYAIEAQGMSGATYFEPYICSESTCPAFKDLAFSYFLKA